ncbi:MAG: hypothetical protein WD689_08125 [Gaiellaceae bacterium]
MNRRSLVVLLGAGAGVAAVVRRRRAAAARVDLYYDDGSMLSLERGDGEADRMLEVAREAIRSARGAA